MADGYSLLLAEFAARVDGMKQALAGHGFVLCGNEPLKLTISTKPYGYTGDEFARLLREQHIMCEFHDPDFVVMMLTPGNTEEDLPRLEQALLTIPQKDAILREPPEFHRCERAMSIREAAMSPCETIPVSKCAGRVLAAPSVGCPPAVPIVICGERIDKTAADRFAYYGTETCTVVL